MGTFAFVHNGVAESRFEDLALELALFQRSGSDEAVDVAGLALALSPDPSHRLTPPAFTPLILGSQQPCLIVVRGIPIRLEEDEVVAAD